MQRRTKDTIIRHLKGIVAALEKEEEKKYTYEGRDLKECSEEEILKTWKLLHDPCFLVTNKPYIIIDVANIMKERGIDIPQ